MPPLFPSLQLIPFSHFIEIFTRNWKKNENIFSLFAAISEISLRNWFLGVESDSEINSKEMERKKIIKGGRFELCRHWDSNSKSLDYKTRALPILLCRRDIWKEKDLSKRVVPKYKRIMESGKIKLKANH